MTHLLNNPLFLAATICVLLGSPSFAEPPEIEHLIKELHGRDVDQQIAAARALGELKNPQSESALVGTLVFSSEPVQIAAKEALRKIEGPSTRTSEKAAQMKMPSRVRSLVVDLGSSYPAVRAWAAGQLGQPGQEAVPAIGFLLDSLEDHESECDNDFAVTVSYRAHSALARIGPPVVAPALARLNAKSASTRAAVARFVGDLGDGRAVAPLIALIRDPDVNVQLAAIRSLGALGDPDAISPLLARTRRPDGSRVAEPIASTFSALDAPGVAALTEMLRNTDYRIREPAALVLAHMKHPDTIEPLLKALNDEHRFVQSAAAQGLGKILASRGAKPVIDAFGRTDADPEVRRVALMVLREHPREIEFLIIALGDQSAEVRRGAANRLQTLKAPTAVPALLQALKTTKDHMARAEVAETLGSIGSVEAVEPLVEILSEKSQLPRLAAVTSLGLIGDCRAVTPLLKLIDHKDWMTRRDVAIALSRLEDDERAVDAALSVLKDPEPQARYGVAWVLGRMKSAKGTKALIRSLRQDTDPTVRRFAAEALGQKGTPEARRALIAALLDPDPDVRVAAEQAQRVQGD